MPSDLSVAEAEAYLSAHSEVKERLEAALNLAVRARASDPLAFIASVLVPPTSPPVNSVVGSPKRFFLGANWKCKLETPADASKLCGEICATPFPDDVEVVLFVPTILIDVVRRQLLASRGRFQVGAQNVWEAVGPMGEHTGSTTATALVAAGVQWVMLGHSDRRNALGETSELIAKKAAAALAAGLHVNLTLGETRDQRDAGAHLTALEAQLAPVFSALAGEANAVWDKIALAYEPVWAIGEGATPCTPQDAQAVHQHIRSLISEAVSPEAASMVRIAYTGSVSPANAASYRELPDVDGFVCGRASLNATDFLAVAVAGQ